MSHRNKLRQQYFKVPLTFYKSDPNHAPYLRFPRTALPRLKAWLQMYGFYEVPKISKTDYLRMRHPFSPHDFIVRYRPWKDKRFCYASGQHSMRIVAFYLANRPIVPPTKRTEDGRLIMKPLGEFPV